MSLRSLALAVALAFVLAACSSQPPPRQALFVVLPNPNGGSGAITVENGQQSVLLDKPYAAEEIRGGQANSVDENQQQVQDTFGSALAARPILPSKFELYFISDSETLTPESAREYRAVFDDIKRRPVYEVEVIGHTDTLGDKTYNQALSLKRAAYIRDRLVHDGLEPNSISIAGRGPLDLKVPTADQVSNKLNRRVVITVR